jgi:PAS domain S-box-containing protein
VPTSHDIYREQVAFMARQTPSNTAVTGGVGLFTSAILWQSVPDLWLFIWIMGHLGMTSLAYIRWRRSLAKKRWATPGTAGAREKSRKRFLPLAVGWATLSGAVWGSAAFFLPEIQPVEQLALIIVMVSMASGASSTLAAMPLAAAGFILADLAPAIIYFFLQGTFVYSALGIMAAIFALALLSSTRTVYGIFLEASRNRRENLALLDQIRDERQAAAESLMLSEARYSDVVRTVGDMIVSTEGEGAFLFTNPAWRETLGYSEDDLSTLTFRSILHETWLPESTERIRSVLSQETNVAVELVLKTKDGNPVWVEGKISPLFENRQLKRINGVFRDIGLRKQAERTQLEIQAQLQQQITEATRELAEINSSLQIEVTERRQAERAWRNSEAQLRLILDSTVEAIYGVDRTGRCTFANSACARLLGFEEAAELLGVDMHTLTHAPAISEAEVNCAICWVHQANAMARADDQNFVRRDGSQFSVEYSARSIIRDGQIVGGVVAFLDITRRRMAEEQLRQSQKMEAIGQLTGGIAHDFNNLLAIIVGNLDLLASTGNENSTLRDAANRRRIDAAFRAAERAGLLTQRLLTFSRKKMLSPQVIDPGKMVSEMSEILHGTLGDGITIHIDIAAPLWEVVLDPSQFENALLNLAINARDAMAGNGVLTLEIKNISMDAPLNIPRLQLPAGNYVRLSVRDTGAGIQPEILDKVFEPFFTTKDVGQGTGLGLSMVYGFVEQSSGYIHLESAPGAGTGVTLYLPRATTTGTKVYGREKQPLNGAYKPPVIASENFCILVVEDDPAVRQSSVAQIKELGYKVLSAEDGPSALALFTANPGINLVYSDVMMPNGMNGPELADRIRAIAPEIKILLCTGNEGNALNLSGMAQKIPILQKPVRKAALAARLQELLSA